MLAMQASESLNLAFTNSEPERPEAGRSATGQPAAGQQGANPSGAGPSAATKLPILVLNNLALMFAPLSFEASYARGCSLERVTQASAQGATSSPQLRFKWNCPPSHQTLKCNNLSTPVTALPEGSSEFKYSSLPVVGFLVEQCMAEAPAAGAGAGGAGAAGSAGAQACRNEANWTLLTRTQGELDVAGGSALQYTHTFASPQTNKLYYFRLKARNHLREAVACSFTANAFRFSP